MVNSRLLKWELNRTKIQEEKEPLPRVCWDNINWNFDLHVVIVRDDSTVAIEVIW